MAKRTKSDSRSSRIGYKSPPRANQFKPGQSGNPSGRPKRPQIDGFANLEKALSQKVAVVENGKRRFLAKGELAVIQFANMLAKGDARALQLLFKYETTKRREAKEEEPAKEPPKQRESGVGYFVLPEDPRRIVGGDARSINAPVEVVRAVVLENKRYLKYLLEEQRSALLASLRIIRRIIKKEAFAIRRGSSLIPYFPDPAAPPSIFDELASNGRSTGRSVTPSDCEAPFEVWDSRNIPDNES
jgi:Family of unknown function (DUF5681)